MIEITEKRCTRCAETKPISEFYRLKKTGYYVPTCKYCHAAMYKVYSNTPGFLERRRAYERARIESGYHVEYYHRPEVRKRILARQKEAFYDHKKRIKRMARWYASNCLRDGKIKREPCAECGKEQSQMHHSDYTKPLLIVWLCSACHAKLMRKEVTE